MTNLEQAERMLFLKQKLQLLNAIIGNKNICYLDLPIHNNFSDSLIMHGTLDFLKKNNFIVKHYLTVFNFFNKAIGDDDVIVFQGGGNFGDIHPIHQMHREKIISHFHRNKIVVLPQTIYYENEKNYKKSCELLTKHDNLHICVRDHKSYELALKMTPHVYLMPDMAHQLYPIEVPQQNKKKINTVQIKRNDLESNSNDSALSVDIILDWDSIIGAYNYPIILLRRVQQLSRFLNLNRFTADLTSYLWVKYNQFLLKKISKKFDLFEVIYSSRLHGYIMANLLNKKTYLIDNSYGKNKEYFNSWFQ